MVMFDRSLSSIQRMVVQRQPWLRGSCVTQGMLVSNDIYLNHLKKCCSSIVPLTSLFLLLTALLLVFVIVKIQVMLTINKHLRVCE